MQHRLNLQRVFRKYHRWLAWIVVLPLALTVITGMLVTVVREWGIPIGIPASLLLKIHSGEIFHLEGIYPILDGIGVIGLLVTGVTMLRRARRQPHSIANQSKS